MLKRIPKLNVVLRKLLGQERQITRHDNCLLIELRQGAKSDTDFLLALEPKLEAHKFVDTARYVPEFDRLVVLCKQYSAAHEQQIIFSLEQLEIKFNWNRSLFSTRTRFPEEETARYRALLEAGMDVLSFSSGLIFRQVGERTYNLFSDLSALSILIENTEQLRRPADELLGEDNTELLIRTLSNVSESFSHGWSGSLVDIVHRIHQWKAEKAREGCWHQLRESALENISAISSTPQLSKLRPNPIPDGPVESYIDTAEKMSIAGFSAGMAFTHSLNNSAAMLFASIPRPAIKGRESFCIELTQKLAEQQVLVLNQSSLSLLDRVDRVVIDGGLVKPTHTAVTSIYHAGKTKLPSDFLERILEQEESDFKGDTYKLKAVEHMNELSPKIKHWWQGTHQPLENLYLVKRGRSSVTAFLVQQIVDQTLESLLAKVRSLGLKVHVLEGAHASEAEALIQQKQLQGSVVLALGRSHVISGADVAVGIVGSGHTWPSGADIVVTDSFRHLWYLLEAVQKAQSVSVQSVELAKIDAFSGLILSLEQIDQRTLGRIRLAANVATLASMINAYRAAQNIELMPSSLIYDATPWHAMDPETVLERLQSRISSLGTQLPAIEDDGAKENTLMQLWVEEMSSPLVPVLMTGAGLAAFTGAITDAFLIAAVIAGNGLIGGIQRRNTEEKLSNMGMTTERTYCVRRAGEEEWVAGKLLVPGDKINLQAGDVVPADARIFIAKSLEVDESSLTGESLPIKKSTKPSFSLNIADRSSMLYEGTVVSQGEVEAVIIAERVRSESRRSEAIKSPTFNGVEARLDHLTELTVPMAAFSGIAVMLSGLSRNQPVQEVIGAGVSLAVAAVPEGLPIMATMAQLSSAGRLSDMGAFARNPRAIEALGRMSVLCADKTGTLTEGKLALKLIAIDGEILAVEDANERVQDVLQTALLASPEGVGNNQTAHVTDEAVGRAVFKHHPSVYTQMSAWKRVKELPFKSERGYHAGLFELDEERMICVKGAPDILVDKSNRWQQPDGTIVPMEKANRERFTELAHTLAGRGFRVLAVCERPARSETLDSSKITRLVFKGFLAISDPVRETAKDAIGDLHAAGIDVKMITGDHPVTAEAIAHELDIDGDREVLTGSQIDALSDEELAEKVGNVSVFARVTPAQKAKIVTALQANGEVVGMTGDGANDAAAIRLAEVGIALGEDSSFAAQKAADLFVVDGQIETIVKAVLEGRALWTAVRDAVGLLVGGNLGEIGFTLVAGLFDGKSPLNARQLLLINLLTDTVPALAVAMRKPDKVKAEQLLAEGPEASLGDALNREIQWRAGLTGGLTTASWAVDRFINGPQHASTVAMLTLIGSQLTQTIVAGKGSKEVIISSAAALAALVAIVQTPGVSALFGCSRPGITGWTNVLVTLVASILGAESLPKLESLSQDAEQKIAETVLDWISEPTTEALG